MSENMNEICDSCKLTTDKLTKHQNYKTTEHQIFDTFLTAQGTLRRDVRIFKPICLFPNCLILISQR
jgi:hypothetical protein